mmetsp:Transcript_6411/g.11408  ORF Transcript_6411/g.11408 Transcript_6411/m.11408 type:complete len:411 (+) Transcript_6411:22-1254(+)
MPPPPPNFLPANRRRQHLDPTRHLKSRELWNQVRFHASASRHATQRNIGITNGQQRQSGSGARYNIKWAIALVRAIAYELQPFRIKPCLRRAKIFICEEEGLQRLSVSIWQRVRSLLHLLQTLTKFAYQQLQQLSLTSIQSFFTTNKSLLVKFTTGLFLLRIYYHAVVYLHELLHAGPIIVIGTLLTLLYTIGLGDNTGAGSGIPSAYSVFNRGMRRILGTVDGEELARQYAGGAMMAGAGRGMVNNGNRMNDDDDDDDGVWRWNDEGDLVEEEEEEDAQNIVNERRRRRRLERLQQQQNQQQQMNPGEGENNANDNNANQQPQPPPEGTHGGIMPNETNAIEDTEQENLRPPANNNNETVTGRKSGKKARRRNLELRREMQRQRQAAAAMGFGEGNDDDGEFEARMALG